jgi:hypothetical protein
VKGTPREVRATGARDAHGHILDAEGGALFVHLHREAGLAHRHYVVKPWQVRILSVVTSRVMVLVYLLAVLTWGWMASQAAQVPFLRHEIARLEEDAVRLDSLSATLTALQSRYDQVQRMLSAATAQQAAAAITDTAKPAVPPRSNGR